MDPHSKFETKMFAAFAAAVLVVAALAATTWKLSRDADEAARWVAHTHEVLESLDHIKADSLAIELATQGYRISGNAARLAERDAAASARETTLRRLKEITADNARQQARWTRLREVADQRLAISRRVELLSKTEGIAAASVYAANAQLQETRERLYRILREMDDEELRLLEERRADQLRTRQVTVACGVLAALSLAMLLTATLVLIRLQMRAVEASRRALAKSEEDLSITLHSIGDAVLATDTDGRVTRMNPVAERLTGWPFAEAQGRSIDEVFRIINEQTRAPVDIPVAKVLASGELQGLANHTLLIARNGEEWPIADSAAPIHDTSGRVSGVVLVFREVSAERLAERTVREHNALLEQRVQERTAQLRESEARLRLLVEAAKDYAIVMLDPQGQVVSWNEGARRIKGYTEAEIIGQPMQCFYPPEDVAAGKPARLLAQAVVVGRCEDEGWRMRQDGTRFYADVILTAIRNTAGELLGFAKITRDISERKRAEQALHEREVRYRRLFESAKDGILILDAATGMIVDVNPFLIEMLGYSHEAFLQKKLWEVGFFHDIAANQSDFAQLQAKQYIRYEDKALQTADGRRIEVEFVSNVYLVNDKKVIQCNIRDISERKRTEAALELERSKLAAAFENVAIGLVICDPQGGDISMNAAALKFHGFTSTADMLRRIGEYADEWELRYPDGRIMPYDEWPLVRAVRGDYVRDYDTCLHNIKTGHRTACSYTSAPVRDSAGDVILIVMTLLDITERMQAEQALLDLNASLEQRVAERTRQLEEASRAKSDFLANMSHELRTPLNSIIGFSEMLKDGLLGDLDPKQRGFTADIFDAGTHLLSLINDILDLSKVEAGMLQLEAGPVNVAALLKASMQVVREKALAHRIQLDTQLDTTLGSMLGDERKLKQIVYNLLSNAVKFTPEGGVVTLHARRCERGEVAFDEPLPSRLVALPAVECDEFLAITVEDTGVGIAEENLPKLFEPFMQVDSSIARQQSGTGLGLSLVRRLAELHGGTVGAASQLGVGSRFCVWLPYRAAASDAPAFPTAREADGATASAVPLALVIEDDDRMAELIEAQLRAEGFETMRAATAEEGLVRAAKHRPQLITLDIFLPEMDGWEFMRRLKAEPRIADTAVVIITVSADLDRGLALGARRVLHKPFAPEELAVALAGLVDARSDGEPACVLVVDDNVQAVELVATVLETEGYRVLRAYGGAEAIRVARSARPDLVILDLVMPQVSGFEVALALRESEHTARIPIVVLTAKDLSAEDHAQLNGAVSAILAKAGFSRSGLLAELRRALPGRARN